MQKIIIPLLILVFFALTAYKMGFNNIFVPPAVREVRDTEESMKRDAREATEEAKKDSSRAHVAGKKWEKLGRFYLRNQNWDGAVSSFSNSIELGNGDARVYYSLAVSLANRGNTTGSSSDFSQAAQAYTNSIKLNNNLLDSRYGLAVLYFYKMNKKDDALGLVQELASSNPKYYKGRFALARFYYEMGQAEKSLSTYEALYQDLRSEKDSPLIREYRQSSSANITRLMTEIGRGK